MIYKITGPVKSGKSRFLTKKYLEISGNKRCLYIITNENELGLLNRIKSMIPKDTELSEVIKNLSCIELHYQSHKFNDVFSILKTQIDKDIIFIDPLDGFSDYHENKLSIYDSLRKLSDYLNADIYVSVTTGPNDDLEIHESVI